MPGAPIMSWAYTRGRPLLAQGLKCRGVVKLLGNFRR